jgi:hypothetical protein
MYEGRVDLAGRDKSLAIRQKQFFPCLWLHRFFTIHAQVFHKPPSGLTGSDSAATLKPSPFDETTEQ